MLQGDFGCSTKFRTKATDKLFPALGATGILMFWVMVTMVPVALLIGILAGMREGSRTDRTLSVASIATTATPEYVSGVIFIGDIRLVARLAQRIGGVARPTKASASTISRCR